MELDSDTNSSLIQDIKKKNLDWNRRSSLQKGSPDKTINKAHNKSQNTSSNVKVINTTKSKPPINIFHQDPKDTLILINKTLGIINFHIKKFNDSKHTLYNDIKDYNRVKTLLKETNTNFYSFTPKEEKNSTFLLKSLNHSFEEKKILDELNNLNIEGLKFHKISRFTTRRSTQKQRILPIFIVQLTQDSKPGLLK